jgi:hypothetical protein
LDWAAGRSPRQSKRPHSAARPFLSGSVSRNADFAYITSMTVAFDTLKLAHRLEAAGFSTKQAQETAEALAETLTANVASQSDIHGVQGEIREAALQLRAEIREVELRLRSEIREVELRRRADMASMRAELIRWVVGIGVAGVLAIGGMILTAAIAILRALPHS